MPNAVTLRAYQYIGESVVLNYLELHVYHRHRIILKYCVTSFGRREFYFDRTHRHLCFVFKPDDVDHFAVFFSRFFVDLIPINFIRLPNERQGSVAFMVQEHA